MNPRNPPQPPFDQVIGVTGCLVKVPKSPPPAAAFPLCAADEPSEYIPAFVPADVLQGGSDTTGVRLSLLPAVAPDSAGGSSAAFVDSSALLARRRRRNDDEPTKQPSPAALDTISRFQMIISAVKSAGTSARSRLEVGELLDSVQCLQLAAGEMRHRQQKRPRCPARSKPLDLPAASGGRTSVSVLQETIAAMEQIRLSEPKECLEEYADILKMLKELPLTEEEDG